MEKPPAMPPECNCPPSCLPTADFTHEKTCPVAHWCDEWNKYEKEKENSR